MYTRDRVSAFSPLGVRYAVGHYSFMIWPVIISTMEVVCGNKDRSQHMQAREAQAQERGREMEQIYGAWYSHFARSCYTFWARGFPDMIEFECTLPYTKVSACCVNISCKHFVSIRGPLYRPIEETTRLIVHLRWRGPRVVVRLDERTCAPRKNTSLDRKAERKTRRKIKQSAKKEDASSCRFGCSEPCWAEPSNFQLCRCTCRLIPIQGGFFCHEDGSSSQINLLFLPEPSFTESWEEVCSHTNPWTCHRCISFFVFSAAVFFSGYCNTSARMSGTINNVDTLFLIHPWVLTTTAIDPGLH